MTNKVIEISDELAQELEPYRDRLRELLLLGLLQLKIRDALSQYERGVISFERAVELTGLSREEMFRQATAIGIQPRWSEHMVQAELT